WRDMSYRGNTVNVRISRQWVERIHVSGNRHGPVQLLLHGSAEGLRGRRVAVHQIELLWRRGETGEPADKFAAISVRGKLADFRNFSAHRNFIAVNAREFPTFEQIPAERSFALVACQNDSVARVGQAPRQVMQDAPARAHAARGDNDAWRLDVVDRFRFLDRSRHVDFMRVQWIVIAGLLLARKAQT